MTNFFGRIRACLKILRLFVFESFHMTYGAWKLARLPKPRVSVFGGSKIDLEHPYARKAMVLSSKLVSKNISVLTGGGPGIMTAANCGAAKEDTVLRSMGITVKGFKDELINACVQELITMNYFYSRKWLLITYSDAYVIFPGGVGTLDELAEVYTLIQTKKIKKVPVVLIGVTFWQPIMDWLALSAREGLLKEEDKDLIVVTDDVDEAVSIVVARCQEVMRERGKEDDSTI